MSELKSNQCKENQKSLLRLYHHSTTRVTHDKVMRFHLKKKTSVSLLIIHQWMKVKILILNWWKRNYKSEKRGKFINILKIDFGSENKLWKIVFNIIFALFKKNKKNVPLKAKMKEVLKTLLSVRKMYIY